MDEKEKSIENERLRFRIKNCLYEWCIDTTAHGFRNIVKTDSNIIRVIWIILVISFTVYCSITVSNSISSYFKYDVSMDYEIDYQTSMEFPAVTICNLNPFDLTTYTWTQTYMNDVLTRNNLNPTIQVGPNDYAIYLVNEASTAMKAAIVADQNLTDTQKQQFGFSIQSMLISCFYNNIQCNTSSFTYFRDAEFGNCYTFNDLVDNQKKQQDSLTISKPGLKNGLVLELFAGIQQENSSQDYFTTKSGFVISIHERGYLPLLKYDGITASTGMSTNVAIYKTIYKKLSSPYSSCRKDPDNIVASDSDYHKKTTEISKYYQKLCFEICLQYQYIIPNCSCADPTIPVVDPDQVICSNMSSTQLQCVSKQRDNFDRQRIDDVCGQYCPLECESISYETSISVANYPTNYYAQILRYQSSLASKFTQNSTYVPVNQPTKSTTLSFGRHKTTVPVSSVKLNMTSNKNGTFFRIKRAGPSPGPPSGPPPGNSSLLPFLVSNQSNLMDIFINQSNLTRPMSPNNMTSPDFMNINMTRPEFPTGNITRPDPPGNMTRPDPPGNISNPMDGITWRPTSGPFRPVTLPPDTINDPNQQQTEPPRASPPDTDTVKASVLMVTIYYEDLKYTLISETPSISMDTLIGLIGGQFGLFVGCSFLTFVEIIEMIITLIRILAGHYWYKPKK